MGLDLCVCVMNGLESTGLIAKGEAGDGAVVCRCFLYCDVRY